MPELDARLFALFTKIEKKNTAKVNIISTAINNSDFHTDAGSRLVKIALFLRVRVCH